MSANRLFQLMDLLLEKKHVTAQDLARELGVSVRTVYRDVDALSSVGIPVFTAQGKGGGISLLDGHSLDHAAFSEEEQRLLLTALQSLPDQDGEAALAKLSALFQRREDHWLQVNLSRWGGCTWDNDTFDRLRRAIRGRQAVRFTYDSSQGDSRVRTVLPARLVFKSSAWYLQAWCPEQEAYRTFRLSRMRELALTDQLFHRRLTPPDIEFSGDLPPLFRVEATLRFAPHLARRVRDEFDPGCIESHPNGSVTVTAVFPEDQWLYGYLLSFGTGVEVLSPPQLRAHFAKLAGEIARVHTET